MTYLRPVSAMVKTPATEAGDYGFDSGPCHIKDYKIIPMDTLLGAQHEKASTGKCLSCC